MRNDIDIYTVALFGHRYIDDIYDIENKLEPIIETLLKTKEYVEILVGRNGEFDRIAASTVRRMKKRLEHYDCSLTLVLPYITAEYEKNEKHFHQYYDEIEICYESTRSHYKAAIGIRNKYMIDRADLVICYVTRPYGGAYQAMRYAEQEKKELIKLSSAIT